MPAGGPTRAEASPGATATMDGVSAGAVVRAEAAALRELAERLDGAMRGAFDGAVDLLEAAVESRRPIALTGVGKSGLIAQKVAATLRSTGAPAQFLHPTEALHGDLGMLCAGDAVVALSASGETAELLGLLPSLQRLGVRMVVMTGCPGSTLGRAAEVSLDTSISEEACPHNLLPTTSTTAMLALGDALALVLGQRRGFAPEQFAALHPAGRLGDRLARVRERMHTGEAMPVVEPGTPMPEVIYEMSRKKLGMTTVCAAGGRRLLGMISDGDLRRMLEREGARSMELTAGEVLHAKPWTIAPEELASAALAEMEARSITSMPVTSAGGELLGVVHLHDLLTRNMM